jgi:hypothetical protein
MALRQELVSFLIVIADTAQLHIVDARRKSRNAVFGVSPTMTYAFRFLDDNDGWGLVRVG